MTGRKQEIKHFFVNREKTRFVISGIIELYPYSDIIVSFIKKDGSERLMKINHKKFAEHMKEVNEEISKSVKKASETRKKNNPHLKPVWDVDKNGLRSINMDTVFKIETPDTIHYFPEKDVKKEAI